mmetsp:Transcript_86516/g.242262  ORF Transcript_86516/g.242262 Transcript_86516/m.242262 type:complete len:467 (-) Transcript_86516:204-1604(-)
MTFLVDTTVVATDAGAGESRSNRSRRRLPPDFRSVGQTPSLGVEERGVPIGSSSPTQPRPASCSSGALVRASGAAVAPSKPKADEVYDEVAATEEVCARLRSEKARLETEIQQFQAAAPQFAEKLRAAKTECAELEAKLDVARAMAIVADKRAAETAARHASGATLLMAKRDATVEEFERVTARCDKLDERDRELRDTLEDLRSRQIRGNEEKRQLKGELLERQGERAAIAADKKVVELAGSQQRVQSQSLEANVVRLSSTLEKEDASFMRHTNTLQNAEALLGKELEDERRERLFMEHSIPKQLEVEREETRHCEDVADGLRREAAALAEKRAWLQKHVAHLQGELERFQRDLWRAEGSRDAARAARRAVESGVAGAEAEITRLSGLVDWVEDQNVQLARSQLPLRKSCSALVEKGVQHAVQEFMKQALPAHPIPEESMMHASSLPYPVSEPPSPGLQHRTTLAI